MRSAWMKRIALLCAITAVGVGVVAVGSAVAAEPWWIVASGPDPAHLAPGGAGTIYVVATNVGDASTAASPQVQITDELPEGVVATGIMAASGPFGEASFYGEPECSLTEVSCTYSGKLPPYERISVKIEVEVEPEAKSGDSEIHITGGGAPSLVVKRPIAVGTEPIPFGVERFEMTPENEGGSTDTQAGSHPFQFATQLIFNKSEATYHQPAMPRDLHFDLPPGFIGNPTPFPQCNGADFIRREPNGLTNGCAPDTVIGVSLITLFNGHEYYTIPTPLFNLKPAPGEPARFGFPVIGNPVILDTEVERGGEYRVHVDVNNITQILPFIEARDIFWGVPGDQRHDVSRGWKCLLGFFGPCKHEEQTNPPPLLTMPTSCGQPFEPTMTADSWAEPGEFTPVESDPLKTPTEESLKIDGCNRLPFSARVNIAPDGTAGSTPTGLSVDVHVPQEEGLNPNGLAPSSVRTTTVTLPEGLALNPSAADGLGSCSLAQINLDSEATPDCPEDAKVGTVTINTPLLPDPLVGAAYLATQDANPFGSLVALYVVAEDPTAGVLVKLAGEVHLSETGQIVSVFKDTPQLPFEDFKLHFFGGSRAPLATPRACGAYTTTASIEPWSGTAPATSSSTFLINSGPNGAPCSTLAPFTPEFAAGTTNIQAGEYSELRTTMGHRDGDQPLGGLSITMPPGLMGSLSHVTLCPEPQASEGTCGPESLIGHTVVTAGLGSNPAVVKRPGDVYITGPYKGAPYGLTIVNPAEAGPFDLAKGTACDCIIVRAKVEVDPHTAQLTITSDPLPTILKGVPLQLKHVTVQIDRPEFTFNPTSCAKMKIEGSMSSSEGVTAPVSSSFQVANCARLPFKPKFSALIHKRHSRKHGAYLHVVVKSSSGQANIKEVHVKLPRALPSRLSTLQQACTEQQFAASPEGCPEGSVVGHATVYTPVLPVPLKGPAYFVSHGGAKYPELVLVLKGYGVTIQLNGETSIKNGITSSTFKTVPDVPFSRFDLVLPTGPHSALSLTTNPCKHKLKMPTRIVAQSGRVIKRKTRLLVTGCHKAKKGKSARHGKRHHGKGHAGKRHRGAGAKGKH